MFSRGLKLVLLGAALNGVSAALAANVAVDAASSYTIDRQDLGPALLHLAQAAGRNILFAPELVRGKVSAAIISAPSFEAALTRLLLNSGLAFRIESDGSATIFRDPKTTPAGRTNGPPVEPVRPEPGTETAVEEIVVAARLRAETLESVPVAVSVISGASLESRNLHDLQSIAAQVPALTFRTSGTDRDRNLFIRGIGTVTTSHGIEPSVSTVIDGVSLARSGQATIDVFDVDHIEVLRGPQGTLFGKNASAGVVNIITKNPTDDARGHIEGEYFAGNEYRLRGGLSGPILDGLDGLISAYTSSYDGNVHDVFDSSDVNGYRKDGVRLKLHALAFDNLGATLAADFSYSKYTTPFGVFASTNQVAYPTNSVTPSPALASDLAATGIVPASDNRSISVDAPSSVVDHNGGTSLQLDWQLPSDFAATSISAYRNWTDTQLLDFDQTSELTPGVPDGRDRGNFTLSQTSQEARLASAKGGWIDFVVGVFYQNVKDDERYERDLTQLTAAGSVSNSGVALYGTENNNYAVFGEANLAATSRLRAILGYRSIWDDVSYYHNRISSSPVDLPGIRKSFTGGPGSTAAHGYSDRLGVQYDLLESTLGYFTYGRGYKGPGFNAFFSMQSFDRIAIAPETSNAFELGIKGKIPGDALRYSAALYRTDYNNYTANFTDLVVGGFVNRLVNAGSVYTQGVEAEATWRATTALELNLALADDDARVKHFICPAGAAVSCNIDGQPLPFAPHYKLHAESDYRHPVSPGFDLDFQTVYDWQSKVQYSLAETPDTLQPAYGILNASLGVLAKHGWSARFLVNNILDRSYSEALARGSLGGLVRFVPRNDRRYVGVTLQKDF